MACRGRARDGHGRHRRAFGERGDRSAGAACRAFGVAHAINVAIADIHPERRDLGRVRARRPRRDAGRGARVGHRRARRFRRLAARRRQCRARRAHLGSEMRGVPRRVRRVERGVHAARRRHDEAGYRDRPREEPRQRRPSAPDHADARVAPVDPVGLRAPRDAVERAEVARAGRGLRRACVPAESRRDRARRLHAERPQHCRDRAPAAESPRQGLLPRPLGGRRQGRCREPRLHARLPGRGPTRGLAARRRAQRERQHRRAGAAVRAGARHRHVGAAAHRAGRHAANRRRPRFLQFRFNEKPDPAPPPHPGDNE